MTFAIPIGQVADIPCGYAVERKDGVTSKITCMKMKETWRGLDGNWKKIHFLV